MTSVNFSNLINDCVVLRAEPAAPHGRLSSKENCKLKHTPSCGIPGIRKGWSCNHSHDKRDVGHCSQATTDGKV